MLILNKESLSDPFVNDYHSDAGFLLCLVVDLGDCIFQLSDFLLKYLSSHSISNSISVDNEVFWEVIMFILEALKGSHNCVFELPVNYLLSSFLDNLL